MKLITKIAITAIICLFLLSPRIFACNNCENNDHQQTSLELIIPLFIQVIPNYNNVDNAPVVVQGGFIVDPYGRNPNQSGWWVYDWNVKGTAGKDFRLTLPNNVLNGQSVIHEDQITVTTYWYDNDGNDLTDGDIRTLVYDDGEDTGLYQFKLKIMRVEADADAEARLHTINQEVSAEYYNL